MFVAIKRDDTGDWALPGQAIRCFANFTKSFTGQPTSGGMVDPGETTTVALKREFGEEALNTDKHPERAQLIDKIFTNGTLIYQGYVDDPRNTDNAWMETRGKTTVLDLNFSYKLFYNFQAFF